MYNRSDGFDTFAQSEGLEREFVERELAAVFENKLHKNDVALVRRDGMPPVYTQCCTKSGVLVQNCIRYLPLDYTGERSAYLSHCLVYSEEEKKQVLSGKEDTAINTGLFATELDSFRITEPDAAPLTDYPTAEYVPSRPRAAKYLLLEAQPDTVKAMLYAILYALCGKGRNVCFKLAGENAALSMRATQVFNELLSILPYQLRPALSFASYVNDPAMYATYKLRGVSAEFPESAAKCVCIDLQTDLIIGVQYDEVVANKGLVNFFYQLLSDKQLRREFLEFMQQALEAIPSLQNLNLKVLTSLVFLFQGGCGLFPEQEVLPSDTAVYDYLCAYEKYRVAIPETYRMQLYRCLMRYAKNHLAIPKNIFAKLSRLYPAEPSAVKRIIMDLVLELIHTDIMRDKLFAFIRSNFQAEDPDRKQIILTDLTRVFYGGFLQNQLLTFFDEQFAGESDEAKTLILEKLLLSIRTPAVQGKILAFLDRHYENMDRQHRESFYRTFLEMLPECDALAETLTELVNRHLESAGEADREALAQQLETVLEADYRRKEHRLMAVLVKHPGFCRDAVIRLAFGAWQSRKLHRDYIAYLTGYTPEAQTHALLRALELVPQLDLDNLRAEAIELYRVHEARADLYLWLELEQLLQQLPQSVADGVQREVIAPAVEQTCLQALSLSQRTDGLQLLQSYAQRHPELENCPELGQIRRYEAMIDSAVQGDYAAAVRHFEAIRGLPGAAEHLAGQGIAPQQQPAEAALCLEIFRGMMPEGPAPLEALYSKYTAHRSAEETLQLMMAVCDGLCRTGETMTQALTAADTGFDRVLSVFSGVHGRGASHWLRTHAPEGAFASHLQALLHQQRAENGGFLSKLFGRKK